MSTPQDTPFAQLIEEKIRDLLLADEAFDRIQVAYKGEPREVPVHLYPLTIVAQELEYEPNGEDGYARSTMIRHWRHELFVSTEVLFRKTDGLVPNADRKADVPTHEEAQWYARQAKRVLEAWSPIADPVHGDDYANDGHTTVGRVHVDGLADQIQGRTDGAENRGTVNFHLYSRVNDY